MALGAVEAEVGAAHGRGLFLLLTLEVAVALPGGGDAAGAEGFGAGRARTEVFYLRRRLAFRGQGLLEEGEDGGFYFLKVRVGVQGGKEGERRVC